LITEAKELIISVLQKNETVSFEAALTKKTTISGEEEECS
jgi:hypothetical protein